MPPSEQSRDRKGAGRSHVRNHRSLTVAARMRCGALVALAGVLLQAVGCLPNETVVDLQMFAADFLRRIAAAALF